MFGHFIILIIKVDTMSDKTQESGERPEDDPRHRLSGAQRRKARQLKKASCCGEGSEKVCCGGGIANTASGEEKADRLNSEQAIPCEAEPEVVCRPRPKQTVVSQEPTQTVGDEISKEAQARLDAVCHEIDTDPKSQFYLTEPVLLKDLQSSDHLNGLHGTICGPYDGEKKRWPVRLKDGTEILVKPINLDYVYTLEESLSFREIETLQKSPMCGCAGNCAPACETQSGMYAPEQCIIMLRNKEERMFFLKTAGLDHYNDGEQQDVTYIRPRMAGEGPVAPFTPIKKTRCIHLRPNGCGLPPESPGERGLRRKPVNCWGLHCNKQFHVSFSKHQKVYEVWKTERGHYAVDLFSRMIKAVNPEIRVDSAFFDEEWNRIQGDPVANWAHMEASGCTIC
jgi:hypothetical protein